MRPKRLRWVGVKINFSDKLRIKLLKTIVFFFNLLSHFSFDAFIANFKATLPAQDSNSGNVKGFFSAFATPLF